MIKTILDKIKKLIKKIEVSKINYLNHRFKKYIIKYVEEDNLIKIINSNGDYKYVENNIANKVKIMEIIKDHKKEIDKKIKYYDNTKEDSKFIIISSAFFLIVLGCTFIFSFFVGSYILFILTFLSFTTTLVLFTMNTYKILLFREEVKRLKNIKNNKIVLDDKELKNIFIDCFTYLKNTFYSLVLKIVNLFDNIKVKFN